MMPLVAFIMMAVVTVAALPPSSLSPSPAINVSTRCSVPRLVGGKYEDPAVLLREYQL